MTKRERCPNCNSDKQTEIITGGITMTIYTEGDFIVREEVQYEKTGRHSRWHCTDCNHELLTTHERQPAPRG